MTGATPSYKKQPRQWQGNLKEQIDLPPFLEKRNNMRPQVLLVTLAVLVVLAALPLSSSKAAAGKNEAGGGGAVPAKKDDANAQAWPCCDKCGLCLLSFPPQCNCLDFSQGGCHPACRNCLVFTTGGSVDEPPVYRCADLLYNYCQRRCTPEPDAV